MASLSASAARFIKTFPSVCVDEDRLKGILDAFDARRPSPRVRLTTLAEELIYRPPVDDLAVPFAHEMIVQAAGRLGARTHDAEIQAASILAGVFDAAERPLYGLRVSIGAPRRGVLVDTLSTLDEDVEALHDRLTEAFALPLGPQEHSDAQHGADEMPAQQWSGHLTTACAPSFRHDALVVLPGRSIGVGESIKIADNLLIPVFAAITSRVRANADSEVRASAGADCTEQVSCRVTNEETITVVRVGDASPGELADAVIGHMATAAPQIRRRQRARIHRALSDSSYRRYLAGYIAGESTGSATARRVADPFEFAGLTDLQREELADELNALTPADFDLVYLLGDGARVGFRALLDSPSISARSAGNVLRAGLREMAKDADEPLKAARHYIWDAEGWRTLADRVL